jgi:hypothetical protein
MKRVDFEKAAQSLRLHLINHGASSAGEVFRSLNISQSTFSRTIARIRNEILIAGRAGRTRYALARAIPGVGSSLSIHEIDERGQASKSGTLHPVHPRGFYYQPADTDAGRFFNDLPYFLDDLRPSGFLGRLIPKQHPELDLPRNITDWSADDCLRYLTRFGADLVGNFVLGDAAFQLYLQNSLEGSPAIPSGRRSEEYPKLAAAVMKFGDPGSSAGGEQPKFSAFVAPGRIPVLVKFSAKIENGASRRRADLLVCEHLALEILKESGHPAAQSCIIDGQGQIFLEIRRFDRAGLRGRKGLISLLALDAEFAGRGRGWTASSEELLKQGLIDQETFKQIRWREAFGNLIADTDMHQANLSFYFHMPKDIRLAPAYDMLPMLYAPQNDQIIAREFKPSPPRPADTDIWPGVLSAATEFWTAAGRDRRISPDFRQIARTNSKKLQDLEKLRELLP